MALKFDTQHSCDFLRATYLNVPGLIWIGGFEPRKFGMFFSTDEEGLRAAVRYAAQMDRASRPKGIYFRCTTVEHPLDDGKRGGSAETFSIPNFWSDLDFGQEGHKLKDNQLPNPPDQDSAYRLIVEAGLPEPTILIHSGGGLYGIWQNTGWYTLEDAARISVNIQAWLEHASNQHGWHYGTGVSDLARVLRLPGSINRKTSNERPCRVIGGSGARIHGSCWPKEAPEKPRTAATALPPRRTTPYMSSGSSVFDALNGAEWADILEPADWDYVKTEHTGAELWMRPGGSDSEYSARCFEHNMVVHSDNAGLPSGPGQRLTKARVFAHLHHGGDLSEAAKDLIKAAHNNGGTVAANSLPAAILDTIKDAVGNQVFHTVGVIGWKKPTVEQFMAGEPGTPIYGDPGRATEDEIDSFLATFTTYRDPRKLGRRADWMQNDPPSSLPRHAHALVNEVIRGFYPADRALAVLGQALKHHGHTETHAPRTLIAIALGAVLADKAA